MTEPTVTQNSAATPFGFFQTLGLAFLAFIAYILAQAVTVIFYIPDLSTFSASQFQPFMNSLAQNGNFISVTTILSTIVLCAILILFTNMRKNHSAKTYLGFVWPTWQEFWFWLALLVGLNIIVMALFYLMGIPMKSQEMIDLYKNTELALLFWIMVIIAAPFAEEFFFRGFLLESWRYSFMGTSAAIFATALIWGIIHIQYHLPIIIVIVLMGILLGLARVKTGSLYLVIALHAINNFASMVEMHFFQLG